MEESDEAYILSAAGDASIKLRDGLLDVKLLVVTPIGVALTIAAAWLWMRKKKLEKKAAGLAKTEPTPKV